MARVYEAVQLSLDRPVALKILAQELAADPSFTKRFLREARIVGRLAHASIVPIYEVGEQDGHYFIAMEYVTGGDLNDAMATGLTEGRVHSILTQVAQALGYAHSHNIVHRDIKPDNVLMRDPATAMVADFGIAREIATKEYKTSLTEVKSVIGSPQYMSPEQMRAESLDQRTDIYSLGVVAWQLLTNELPHTGRTLSELAVAKATQGIPVLPDALAHWQPLMSGMLAYHRDERFTDCDMVLSQLARLKTPGGTIVAKLSDAGDGPDSPTGSPTEVVRPGSSKVSGQSYLSTGAFMALSVAVVSVAGLLLWWLISASTAQDVVQEVAVPSTPVVQTNTGETSAEPTWDTAPAKVAGLTAALQPSPAEFFAYRDLLEKPDNQSARDFVSTYKGSVYAAVVRVYLLGERALLDELRLGAQNGDLKSLLVMSDLHANGWGVSIDIERAEEYARIAQASGSQFAQAQLASLMLDRAKPVAGKFSPAILRPLQRSAEGGFFLAQTLLGDIESGGLVSGQPRLDRSVALYKKAAEQGDRNALFNLARVYRAGMGDVPKDTELSRQYLAEARALGHPQALALPAN